MQNITLLKQKIHCSSAKCFKFHIQFLYRFHTLFHFVKIYDQLLNLSMNNILRRQTFIEQHVIGFLLFIKESISNTIQLMYIYIYIYINTFTFLKICTAERFLR